MIEKVLRADFEAWYGENAGTEEVGKKLTSAISDMYEAVSGDRDLKEAAFILWPELRRHYKKIAAKRKANKAAGREE